MIQRYKQGAAGLFVGAYLLGLSSLCSAADIYWGPFAPFTTADGTISFSVSMGIEYTSTPPLPSNQFNTSICTVDAGYFEFVDVPSGLTQFQIAVSPLLQANVLVKGQIGTYGQNTNFQNGYYTLTNKSLINSPAKLMGSFSGFPGIANTEALFVSLYPYYFITINNEKMNDTFFTSRQDGIIKGAINEASLLRYRSRSNLPDGQYPVLPYRIHIKVQFVKNGMYVQNINPQSALNFSTLFKAESATVRFFVQKGPRPASISESQLTNTTQPMTIDGKTQFSLDKQGIKFWAFTVGQVFYKNFPTPLQVTVSNSSQYIVAQFQYKSGSAVKTVYSFLEDVGSGYSPQTLNPPGYREINPHSNSFGLFLSGLSNKISLQMML